MTEQAPISQNNSSVPTTPPGPAPSEEKKRTPKQIVEENLVVFFLSTLLAGFLAGLAVTDWLGREPKWQSLPDQSPQAHTLRITRVERAGDSLSDGYRLTLYVNDQPYSYPARTLWGTFGGTPEAISFLLPTADSYKVHMAAWIKTGADIESVTTSEIKDLRLPNSNEAITDIYSLDPLEIKYQVR